MADDEVVTYPGQKADIRWDGRLCIHVGECGRATGELFVGGRKPWCQPDLAGSVEEAKEVVERCPTGALTLLRKDSGAQETAAPLNRVTIVSRGPLYLRGQLEIEGAPDDAPGLRYRAALCRCGKSANKPYCDNSHESSDFDDRGAVGDQGSPLDSEGGPLGVKVAPDGPLLVNGNFKIVTPSGREAYSGTRAALCRCGESKNKPFCDGSHKAAGFKG